MIAIIDYGVGNLRSVEKAFQHVGADALVTADPEVVRGAAGVVLPGVGAFGDGIEQLAARGFVPVVKEIAAQGRPLLGICLGMQFLFGESEEMGQYVGLGLLPGRVVRFHGELKVPHIGWNQVCALRPSPLLAGLPAEPYAYFVHSYYVEPADPDDVLATTDYGGPYASVVGRGHIFGLQFHPEKSQEVGLRMLRNFADLV
jgi:imidazole glycerol-phosphate synthase subunit HisH